MLEILFLFWLTKRIGAIVEPKGHKGWKYKLLTVGLWFGGEIVGAFIGAFIASGSDSSLGLGVYVIALIGAGIGAFISFTIAKNLEPLPGYPQLAGISNNLKQ
jgi:hypothetical protein